MRSLLGTTVTLALTLAACSGNVVVDNPSTGGSHTGTTTGTITSGITTTSGPCSPTCSAVLTTGGPPPCGGSALSAYNTLVSCACGTGNLCEPGCGANFCLHEAASGP